MSDMKTITLKGVELRWAFLAEPSTRGEFASNKYQVDVVMDKEQAKLVKELKNARQSLKDLGDGKFSITLKSSRKPKVVNAKKVVMSDDDVKSIANGTTAIVKANQYTGFKGAIFLGLGAVMVTNLVQYSGADDFADIDVDADDSAPFDTDDDELI
jgi:hypothetical protein